MLPSIQTIPRSQAELEAIPNLSKDNPWTEAPTPTGSFFKPTLAGGSIASQYLAFLKASKQDAAAVEMEASQGAFTNWNGEVRNQERVRGFHDVPYGASNQIFSLAPEVSKFNVERLNSGEEIMLNMNAWRLRESGNAWGDLVNASNWAQMAEVMRTQATTDTSGFADIHTGEYHGVPTTWMPQRGGADLGGTMFNEGSKNVNSGAAFSKEDGSAAGAVALTQIANSAGAEPLFSALGPSGAGALAVSDPYGLNVLLGL